MCLSRSMSWYRYIDGVLLLWARSKEELKVFVGALDYNPYNLKFTCDYSKDSITFLDLTVMLTDDGHIKTKLYRKETATNSLLLAKSYHPKTLVKNITVSQYLGERRNCTDSADFE